MSDTNSDVTAGAVDKQLQRGHNEGEVARAERSPQVDKTDPDTDVVASAESPDKRHPAKPDRQPPKAGKRNDGAGAAASAPSLRDRLLASFILPPVKIDPKSLPPQLYDALDAANLTGAENLPVAVFTTLTAITAVAAPGLQCALERPGLGMTNALSLRLALVAGQLTSPVLPPPILGAVYDAEADALDAHTEEVKHIDQARQTAEQYSRLRDQAARSGIELAIDLPLPDEMPDRRRVRPRMVVVDKAASAILAAAAGETGILVVDHRRCPWLATIGDNYDTATDALLNAAAAGHPIPVENPITGRVTMRSLPVSVVGVLERDGAGSLCNANRAQLAATVFMQALAPPSTGDHTKISEVFRRVRSLPPVRLQLPRTEALVVAAEGWLQAATDVQKPAADFLMGAPDLTRRLAAALHLATMSDATNCAIPAKTVAAAIRLVNDAVLPFAAALLEPCSTSQVERDARRIIGYLRTHASLVDRLFERRALLRSWQRSMSALRLDAALALLVEADLLKDMDAHGRLFEVAPAVFEAI